MTLSVSLPYGDTTLAAALPAGRLLGVFDLPAAEFAGDEEAILRAALARPIGAPRLREIARAGERVAVIISDNTRPCPSERMLPAILDELFAAGVADADITVVAALGLHRPMTDAEWRAAVGPAVWDRVRVLNHDPADTVRLGATSRAPPVEIFRPVVEANRRVCLGNLEFHYFAGFSGGAKAILPGCASRAAVTANHALMVQPGALAGHIEDNPVRLDLEEGVSLVGVDFILNVLVAPDHRIVAAVAGDVTAAHRAGCELVPARGQVVLPALADVALASAGGFPKDINLYQAQKALDNAAYAVRDGGVVILVAECREGFGNATFERWLREAGSPDDLLCWIQREFVLGGHKAAAIGAVLRRAEVYLVSAMPAETVAACGLTPFETVRQALDAALARTGPAARVAVLPSAGSVLPVCQATR